MKKKYVAVLFGCLAVMLAAACGKKEDSVQNNQVQATIEISPTAAPVQSGELVNMKKSTVTPTPTGKSIGTKTSTSKVLTLANQTGKTITQIYLRPYSDDPYDDEWDEELVKGAFELEAGEKCEYNYEKTAIASGKKYDIRVVYNDQVDVDENYFRNLPLASMSQITLNLNTDGIPYATYYDSSTKKNVSTLNEVLVRMGLAADSSISTTPAPQVTGTPTPAPSQDTPTETQVPSNPDSPSSPGYLNDPTVRDIAQEYIGRSISELMADPDVGQANDFSYGTDPDMGEGGYYYYNNFTVFTSIDENGNEIVTQIW